MEGVSGLELHPVEVRLQIGLGRLLLIIEDMVAPAVTVGSGQIPSSHLLQHVRYVEGLQQRQVCWLQAVFLSDLLQETRPRKGPLVRADGKKEGWEPVLPDSIQQVQILLLPVGG